jgi:hypothetical protein
VREGIRMIVDTEINKIVEYLDKIGKTTRWVNSCEMSVAEIAKKRSRKDEYGSKHDFKLVLADACLAWRNLYKKKVIPRLEFINRQYAHIKTLEELRKLISVLGDKFNNDFWNFDSQRRKEMFTELVDAFIEYKKRMNTSDDLEAMKHWARNASPENYNRGINGRKITCLGIANFQYLLMLCGVDAIKPDSHILKGTKEALGYAKKPLETIRLIEKVSIQTGISMLEIDQILWVHFTDEVPDIGWQDDM